MHVTVRVDYDGTDEEREAQRREMERAAEQRRQMEARRVAQRRQS